MIKNNKKSVLITLKTTITDGHQQESTEVKAQGTFMTRPSFDVLKFTETTEEGHTINNLITIQENYVSIKRSGIVSMHQRFIAGELSESMYEHPHGTIHMETTTTDLNYLPLSEDSKGRLTIRYTVSLNGQPERHHKLVLTYEEEDF